MSRIIKSHTESNTQPKRMIAIKPLYSPHQQSEQTLTDEEHPSEQLMAEKRLQEMEKQAQQMMDEAELQSEQLTELFERKEQEMSVQAEQLFEENRKQGYEEGYKQGEQSVWATYSDKILEAQSIIEQASVERDTLLKQAEPQMIRLAYLLAEKVLGQALESDQNTIQFLKKQIYEAREHEDLKLFVHPTWYQIAVEQKQELTTVLPSTTQLLVIPDHQLDEQECIIETKQGRLHTSMDQQLAEIKKQLLEKQKELTHD
ncbi:flagellar assembly protein FliH [Alkalicoccobacillus plakortidis]|uniref:Flagellar assembly protein FliH n=1 Tax=Alkalicoccobacillus plakortidis TaxID=444060 RepID=A0ABT0XFU3_9BACI|nr:flagellar assembly protein FliH [Alkalicoccobacillus plakortidis]MCM2674739.1 flagellar assembly protein FliH [Alkalicoccobacillus plakortidis]